MDVIGLTSFIIFVYDVGGEGKGRRGKGGEVRGRAERDGGGGGMK